MAGLKNLGFVKCSTRVCDKACLILQHTHESSQALHMAYELARAIRSVQKQRESKSKEKKEFATLRGMTTDEEQDLLRSMLVTAASGLDAMTKQLIRDALPKVIEIDKEALIELEKFVTRRLRDESDETEASEKVSFLSRVLTARSAQSLIIEDYIVYLTKGSLQSTDELTRVAKAFGISQKEVHIDNVKLRPIFEARNKIIHDLDINFNVPHRKRNLRKEGTMKTYTEALLDLAESFLKIVDTKLSKNKS